MSKRKRYFTTENVAPLTEDTEEKKEGERADTQVSLTNGLGADEGRLNCIGSHLVLESVKIAPIGKLQYIFLDSSLCRIFLFPCYVMYYKDWVEVGGFNAAARQFARF
jgi:hypothetical protein